MKNCIIELRKCINKAYKILPKKKKNTFGTFYPLHRRITAD